jgi:hypothetical protein
MQNKFIRRLLLLYFFIQVLPLNAAFWRDLFAGGRWHLSYGGLFHLTHYMPGFSAQPGVWPDWAVFLLLSAVGAAVWQRRAAAGNDEPAAYWVRTLVRYRLATAMLAYGFIKLFPLQSPYPSISNLNTNYGDFTRWKLFSLSLGIVPSYESFLGLVEIVAALLLFYRRSASVGAFILAIFLGNVFMSNWAYGGGDTVYSLYLITLALFVVSYDAQRLADLLLFQKPASPNTFRPLLLAAWQRKARVALKVLVLFVFVILYGFQTRNAWHTTPYQFPVTKGLDGTKGIYNVSVFKKGKDSIGYSRADSVRWQDLVFESWATISIRSNRPVVLDSVNVERLGLPDSERDYELQGTAGRHYYRYEVDTARHLLTLHDKNPHNQTDQLVLHYDRPDSTRIILSGIDQDRDSVYAVLQRRDKKYLLEESSRSGRTKGLKL